MVIFAQKRRYCLRCQTLVHLDLRQRSKVLDAVQVLITTDESASRIWERVRLVNYDMQRIQGKEYDAS